MTAQWSEKLDPYWSIGDMMKTNNSILSQITLIQNVISLKKYKQTKQIACVNRSVELH